MARCLDRYLERLDDLERRLLDLHPDTTRRIILSTQDIERNTLVNCSRIDNKIGETLEKIYSKVETEVESRVCVFYIQM